MIKIGSKPLKIIMAINNLGYIGKNGEMLWRSSEDFKHFKNLTLNTKCIVGRKTYDLLPPLKNRELVVVGRDYTSLEDALNSDADWVIGGAEIYNQLIHFCDEVHLSIINDNSIGDTSFEIPESYKGKIFKYHFEVN